MKCGLRFQSIVAMIAFVAFLGCTPSPTPSRATVAQTDFEVIRFLVNGQDLTFASSKGVAARGEALEVDLRFKSLAKPPIDQSTALAMLLFKQSDGAILYPCRSLEPLSKEGDEYRLSCRLRGSRVVGKMMLEVKLPGKSVVRRDFDITSP